MMIVSKYIVIGKKLRKTVNLIFILIMLCWSVYVCVYMDIVHDVFKRLSVIGCDVD